ncbi:L,D-transpeptidase family protein [Rhodomicrobium vannielii ATCC 17100]|uniref:L,D-transpeptidase family protein n=1 Tax=Rhodomicrobium vannielii TaxID=1069 RepID=UPI00191AE3BC|nr:L,D-transpeptidase family protein [Rhodomicrobium vannielii]MBJ7534642.1 L,D-transpeptidase family protein [Rhodomicrobium vannielii ATCC 17100]
MKKFKLITSCAFVVLVVAGLSAPAPTPADARSNRYMDDDYTRPRFGAAPVLAIVGLKQQRITVYDARGKMLESPVSSGATGYETPPGIYSIVQKKEEHHSNLYDDASMPYMQRILWTGIALHEGVLPGYAASHGCIRLPGSFAQRLFGLTNMGMRVIVAREDIAPAPIAQPFLFGAREVAEESDGETSILGIPVSVGRDNGSDLLQRLRLNAMAKTGEAEVAARREKELKQIAQRKAAEAAPALKVVAAAERDVAKAEANLAATAKLIEGADTDAKAEKAAKAKELATAKLDSAREKLAQAKAQAEAKAATASTAKQEAEAAEEAKSAAQDAADEAELNTAPVSVLISRKTHRLYIRKANQPIYEGPVSIRDDDKPIGSFVYTAVDASRSGTLNWTVVSLYKDALNVEPYVKQKEPASKKKQPPAPPHATDVAAATAALDRLTVPQEALDKISAVVLPGSSLIITDEAPSVETGKDTDFIVFMSGEPAGSMAIRKRAPSQGWARRGGETDFWGNPRPRRYGGGGGGWSRGGGGGFPSFFGGF